MSTNLLQAVWSHFPGGGAELPMLLAIAEASNEQGNCYLPLVKLARAARQSRANGHRAISRLRRERWIVTSRMLGKGGQLVYQLNLPKLARSVRPGVDLAHMEAQRNRATGATEAGLLERVSARPGAVSSCAQAADATKGDASRAMPGRERAFAGPEVGTDTQRVLRASRAPAERTPGMSRAKGEGHAGA